MRAHNQGENSQFDQSMGHTVRSNNYKDFTQEFKKKSPQILYETISAQMKLEKNTGTHCVYINTGTHNTLQLT